jgi:hypothetical protein
MKKISYFSIFMIWMFLSPISAHAILYTGGNGRGEAVITDGSRAVMTMTSTADQTFTVADASTAMSTITITQQFSSGDGVLAANDIRVKIVSPLDMTWDSSITTATVAGGASGKVSTTVSYANSNKTLVVDVTSDFSDGDSIIISGLKFKNFNSASSNYLQLEIDNAGTTIGVDPYIKNINLAVRTTGFLGGNGRGETNSRTARSPNALFYYAY